MVVSNRNLLFQGSIFRGYVSFREGTSSTVYLTLPSPSFCWGHAEYVGRKRINVGFLLELKKLSALTGDYSDLRKKGWSIPRTFLFWGGNCLHSHWTWTCFFSWISIGPRWSTLFFFGSGACSDMFFCRWFPLFIVQILKNCHKKKQNGRDFLMGSPPHFTQIALQ